MYVLQEIKIIAKNLERGDQKDLAERFGYTPGAVHQIFNGNTALNSKNKEVVEAARDLILSRGGRFTTNAAGEIIVEWETKRLINSHPHELERNATGDRQMVQPIKENML